MLVTFPYIKETQRAELVSFNNAYHTMLGQIKSALLTGSTKLVLGRLVDEKVEYSGLIQYHLITMDQQMADVYYFVDEEKRYKTIRFDSPLGEFPVFPYKRKDNFLQIGQHSRAYDSFIKQIKQSLPQYCGQDIKLFYKNDNDSTTVIWAQLVETNKSNFLCFDYQKITDRGPSVEQLGRPGLKRNHRFISQNGFLFKVEVHGINGFKHFSFVDEDEILETV